MKVYSYQHKLIIAKIQGNLTREEITKGPNIIYGSIEKITSSQRVKGEKESAVFICKVHPNRLGDIRKWPEDDAKLCKWLSSLKVKIKRLSTTVIGDFSIPKDETHWEIYFGEVKNK